MKRILKDLCIEAAPEWKKQVLSALFALRAIRHKSPEFIPSELVYGRNLRTLVTLLYEQCINPENEENNIEHVFQFANRLKRCKELTLDKMLQMQTKRKMSYDLKAIKREFSEGDLVLVVSTSNPNKLSVEWKESWGDRKEIIRNYLCCELRVKKDHNQVYHANMLKPYHK
ncbi:hypothetical protein AVEN_272355-1 [Araneus ventricosus]|uniref:Uncharacterized protein n=1 Tax=Araneus ventricosus TaxID=182803 RepID=A0A4Y2GRC0_ARAVE|nr:hypothetical protein AVEN_272355-1 [Araneus ventricosus]